MSLLVQVLDLFAPYPDLGVLSVIFSSVLLFYFEFGEGDAVHVILTLFSTGSTS